MAQAVIERLIPKRVEVVLIDDNTASIEALKRRFRKLLVVEGKGTSELALAQANLSEAKNIVAATESEVDNLLIGITCKDLDDKVTVIAHSNDISIANRMRKAGFDEVISPIQLCGDRVADVIHTAATVSSAPVGSAT
jgi:voltage-gated potassium channel